MQIITTDKIAKSNGPYSQGYTHNGFFFTAGQIGVEPSDGELHVHTIEEQTDRACRNIGIMLEAAGTSFDKVIKANFRAGIPGNPPYRKGILGTGFQSGIQETFPGHQLADQLLPVSG